MAGKDKQCYVCGALNESNATRCSACGAAIESNDVDISSLQVSRDGLHQESFSWPWMGISTAVFALAIGVALVALPSVLSNYDPQGFYGVLIAASLFFLSAVGVAIASPNHTLLEPAVGAAVMVAPTLAYVASISDVYPLTPLAGFFGGTLVILVALFGAMIGEMVQLKRSGP